MRMRWLKNGRARRLLGAGLAACCVLGVIDLWIIARRVAQPPAPAVALGDEPRAAASPASQPPPELPPGDAPLDELAAAIRPAGSEEPWLRVGWLASLREAQAVARDTHRLIFLWATNQPMGRC